jgi:hypothetical protein
MRRILNLNQPGAVFLKIIGLLFAVIPAGLSCALLLFNNAEVAGTLHNLIRISFALGALALVILVMLIIMEQVQDHYLDVQYHKRRDHKLPLADGKYECQYCGNRAVREIDKTCSVCGRQLNRPEAAPKT